MKAIRSMTGFARSSFAVRENLQATLTGKSVNHRFLDIQIRVPAGLEQLEPLLRAAIKQNVLRGHVDLYLNVERAARGAFDFNADAVHSYLAAFRAAAMHAGLNDEPNLNMIFRMPGVVSADHAIAPEDIELLEQQTPHHATQLLRQLNAMRAQEGEALVAELRQIMQRLNTSVADSVSLRGDARQARLDRMQQRISELTQGAVDADRILQEAALLSERADVEEETVRLRAHIAQFLEVLDSGGEVGKKLDFLLQEMNREANTLLSKTTGTAGNALEITEIGLALKSGIEKAREQVQNIE